MKIRKWKKKAEKLFGKGNVKIYKTIDGKAIAEIRPSKYAPWTTWLIANKKRR